jgi:uncharacterized peroxidase-related enzyme
MKPMLLPAVEQDEAGSGAYAQIIATVKAAGQPIPQIWRLFAYKPDATKHLEHFTHAVMRGPSPLSPGLRELIATVTSARNQTAFCATTHAAATIELLKDADLVREAMQDVQTSHLPATEKLLLRFVEKVNSAPWTIGPADIGSLHEAGWTDEAIYDAITVCALFNFYNRWVSATGVCQMGEDGIRTSGKRIAETGYIRTKL